MIDYVWALPKMKTTSRYRLIGYHLVVKLHPRRPLFVGTGKYKMFQYYFRQNCSNRTNIPLSMPCPGDQHL